MNKKIKWRTEYNILLILIIVFAALFAWTGVQEFPDTVTYVEMYLGREPVYPLFLALCRLVFGESGYLLSVVILQNLFALGAVYLLVETIKRTFCLNAWWTYAVLFLSLSPYLLSPLGSGSHMALENGIISEGLTYPLYYVLLSLFLRILYGEKQWKNVIAAFAVTLLLSLTRGQMLPLLLVWAILGGYFCVKHGEGPKILLIILVVALGFIVRNGLFQGYNLLLHGTAMTSNNANTTFFTNILYSATEEDGKDIPDEKLKGYYQDMVLRMNEEGWQKSVAGKSLTERIYHQEDSHDKIKFNIAELYITWYINDVTNTAYTGYEREALKEEAAGSLTAYVLPNSFFSWLGTYFVIAAGGFIRTIAVVHPLLNLYTLAMYLTAAILMLYLFYRDKRSKAATLMLFAFLLICANVFATAMTIMCLSRYMIYNMPVFYIAGLLLLRELWQKRRKNGISEYSVSEK